MAVGSSFELIQLPDEGEPRLESWRKNCGRAVALDVPQTAPPRITDPPSLLVLSWNVWIGRGRLGDVVSRIRSGDFRRLGAEPDLPLVILLQEAWRTDPSLPPPQPGSAGRIFLARGGPQEDIVEAAQRLGLSLRYAPSMRNGLVPSDRGNAILSTLPLMDAHAVELPLVLQRRVAVSAAISVAGWRLRIVSAHLDPRGPPGHRWFGAAGRELQVRHLISLLSDETVVLGADLNLGRGRYEPAWRLLCQAGFTLGVPPFTPPWRHTFHALPRLLLDYLLIRDSAGIVHRAEVHRLDEHPQDRGARVFGSDHHPLLARIDLHSREESR